jgi:leucyl/phenylalanyl-tRNA--protein transferase
MHGKAPTDLLLDAYRKGIFPMAESAEDENFAFYHPYQRGILPIADLHMSQSLLKTIRRKKFHVSINRDFESVIDGCAGQKRGREKTWINKPIRNLFVALHREGHAHSVECRDDDGAIVGGLYGLSIGAVFCGESMFSKARDASKVALVHLCAQLCAAQFTILDTQFINPHLLQFGAFEIPQEEYEAKIKTEMKKARSFPAGDVDGTLQNYLTMRGF